MNEIKFIKINGKRWQNFDHLLSNKNKNKENSNPDRLARLYIELTDDLAYAKTFFPKSKTTKYLNQITLKAHQQIFKRRKIAKNSLLRFFIYDYPITLFRHRKKIIIAFIFFVLSAVIGAVSFNMDEEFARYILGDSYVNMTIENMENGHPMGVYNSKNETLMFFGIAWNNIRVALLAFAMGIFFSIGTYILLFYNGVMLGVFQALFIQHGFLKIYFLTVWMHGTIEISSIIIAASAGLVMGNSLLFPGTLPRIYSLQKGALEGVKIVIGLIPFFIIAAFIESFLTRHSESSYFFDSLLIIASSLLIVFYFFIYPYFITKKLSHEQYVL